MQALKTETEKEYPMFRWAYLPLDCSQCPAILCKAERKALTQGPDEL